MCRKLFNYISLLLVLSIVGNVMAQLDPATVDTGHVYLLDDVSGTQVQDDSANNNPGTIVGDPQVVTGLNSNALLFDGIDDGIHPVFLHIVKQCLIADICKRCHEIQQA